MVSMPGNLSLTVRSARPESCARIFAVAGAPTSRASQVIARRLVEGGGGKGADELLVQQLPLDEKCVRSTEVARDERIAETRAENFERLEAGAEVPGAIPDLIRAVLDFKLVVAWNGGIVLDDHDARFEMGERAPDMRRVTVDIDRQQVERDWHAMLLHEPWRILGRHERLNDLEAPVGQLGRERFRDALDGLGIAFEPVARPSLSE